MVDFDLLAKAQKQRAEVLEQDNNKKEEKPMFEEPKKETPKKAPVKRKVVSLKDKVEKIGVEDEAPELEVVNGDLPTKSYPIQTNIQSSDITLPTEADVDQHLKMYNYVKKKVVSNSDFASVKGKKFLKKSGVRKFIQAFGISIELVDKTQYATKINGLNDYHAEVRVRAITQKGQSVEGIGIKSMSELFEKNMHNLVATAWTRAVNRAILDLVAFGEVSAEEIMTNGKSNKNNMSDMF